MLGKHNLQLIAAVDLNNGIGFEGGLITRSKMDMKVFQQYTNNKVVLCGRKTFDSIPVSKEGVKLPGRIIGVLTNQTEDQFVEANGGKDSKLLENVMVFSSNFSDIFATSCLQKFMADRPDLMVQAISETISDNVSYEDGEEADVVVIGGAEIYKLFMPYVDEALISEFNSVKSADTYFPMADFKKYMTLEGSLYSDDDFELFQYMKKTA